MKHLLTIILAFTVLAGYAQKKPLNYADSAKKYSDIFDFYYKYNYNNPAVNKYATLYDYWQTKMDSVNTIRAKARRDRFVKLP